MDRYLPRLVDETLRTHLSTFGATAIVGPKWCGKTTTAKQVAESTISLQDKKQLDRYKKISDLDISLLLRGDAPLLIDEWQMIPEIWDAVRFEVDERGKKGQFILTGSASIDKSAIRHSGAGRISIVRMRTMTLFESGRSTGTVTLEGLFDGREVSGSSEMSLEDVAKAVVRGGWPGTHGMGDSQARMVVDEYCDNIQEMTMRSSTDRDSKRMHALLRSLARNSASQASVGTLIKDMEKNDNVSIGQTTAYKYLKALDDIFVTDDLEAWGPSLRSKAQARTSDTRHLTDPAIAAHFLDADPEDLLYDPNTFGLLFESMAARDLRAYAEPHGGKVYHYRDSDGLEVDLIVHLRGGKWGAFEVKLTDNWADAAAANLIKLRDKTDSEKMNPPSVLAVITATGMAYRRRDGVYVIPLSCLKDRREIYIAATPFSLR